MTHRDDLALVADELPVAIWMGRVPGGEAIYTNRAFREVLGIEPPEGAARGSFVAPYGVHTLAGDVYPEEQMPFERVLQARGPVTVDDLVIHRRDGRKVNLRVYAKPIFDEAGTLTHVLEAFLDISREVDAERARAEGERRLARSQRLDSIGQLVAGIAHDFNNLLTVTKLAVSWLQRGTGQPSDQKDALGQVAAATESAIALVKNLLHFATPTRRSSASIHFETALRPVLDMAARTLDPSVTLTADLGAPSARVVGDRSQIEQLAMNLVLNARDAIKGSGEIVVRTRTEESSPESSATAREQMVVLEVLDTGGGIEPSIRDRIFEPYFTTKTMGPIKGTGLGLSIVHSIVDAHAGSIELGENQPRGTVVRVVLPSAPDVVRAAGDQRAALQDAPQASGEPGPLILVVDDEPLVRASTGAALRALGYRVHEAADGDEAIALFRQHKTEIDAVVLDMVMPGLRGRDVYLSLREVRADLRVLLVTGNAFGEEVQSILDLGVGGWLPKPYDSHQLVAGLRQIGAV